jgi:hypothetical protein
MIYIINLVRDDKNNFIPRAGQFCALQTDAVRRPIWITSNKRSAVRGTAYISPPQLRKELNSNSFFHQARRELNSYGVLTEL